MARFRPLSFDQWRDHMAANTSPDELVECPDCHGEGVRECCECSHQRECTDCDEGKVPFGELSESQRVAHFSRARYEAAVMADAIAWGGWCRAEPAEVLTDAGFVVATQVRTRCLQIVSARLAHQSHLFNASHRVTT